MLSKNIEKALNDQINAEQNENNVSSVADLETLSMEVRL